MRAAALAFGSQAGLARRGWEIAAMLERHADRLSAVYRFRDLTLRVHGFTVMPPVLGETSQPSGCDGTEPGPPRPPACCASWSRSAS